jgi:hypothetical protein
VTTYNKKSPDKKRSINTTSVVIDSSSEAVVELENDNVEMREERNENQTQLQVIPNLQEIQPTLKKLGENDKAENKTSNYLNSSILKESTRLMEENKTTSNPNSEMRKKLIDLDDEKQINYNQKFFDYRNMPLKRVSEERESVTNNNNISYNNKRSKKHDWIKKDKSNDPKEQNKGVINLASVSNAQDKPLENLKVENYEKIDILSSDSEKIDEDINNIDGCLINKNLNGRTLNNSALVLLSQNQQSNKKSENLSLDFESQINSKDKLEIKPLIPSNYNKPGSKFSDFMKLKKEKNLPINQNCIERNIPTEFPTSRVEKNNYELDLHTLESTFNEFYDIGPKVKKNIFIPEGIKNRAYKSVGGNVNQNNLSLLSSNLVSNKGVVRNKKEREKMNGYKCEICENVNIFLIKFYDILGDKSDSVCQMCSRHRKDDDPNRTPKGFYETTI